MADLNEGGLQFVRSVPIESDTFVDVENLYYTDADGNEVVRNVVRHMGAVVVVPIHDDNVVMIRQYRAAIDDGLVELPAGKLDVEGESLESAASRECIEEVGYKPGQLEYLTSFFNSPGFTDERTTVFVAENLTFVGRQPHGPEEVSSEVIEIPLASIPAMLIEGEITDAKSMIGLFAYLQLGR
jgi:nudix-type nucleoside diphosphatase (YffH/AdpP family)